MTVDLDYFIDRADRVAGSMLSRADPRFTSLKVLIIALRAPRVPGDEERFNRMALDLVDWLNEVDPVPPLPEYTAPQLTDSEFLSAIAERIEPRD